MPLNIISQPELLTTAVCRGDLDRVREMLDHGASAAGSGQHGLSPVHWAVQMGHVDVLKLLLARGGSANSATNEGLTPLHMAAREGDVDMARALLAADPSLAHPVAAEEARLLADLAGFDSEVGAVELLVEAGWDLAAGGLDGGTPLHQAAWFGAPRCARVPVQRLAAVTGQHVPHPERAVGRPGDDAAVRQDVDAPDLRPARRRRAIDARLD